MSVTTSVDPTPAALVSEIGNMLADAMNTLSLLSRQVAAPAPTLPPRRRVLAAPAPAAAPTATPKAKRSLWAPVPVLRPKYLPPVNPPAQRKPREQGAADRIVAAITSRHGVLSSDLHAIAGYATSAAYLNRLSKSRGLTWWTTGTGAKLRYCGKL